MNVEFYWLAVTVVTIVSASRLTRLATVDKLPPVKAVRDWYEDKTDGTGWVWLTMCGYCFSFWATALVVSTGIAADVYGDPLGRPENHWAFLAWWTVNGTLAASYLAAVFMAFDGDTSDDTVGDDD